MKPNNLSDETLFQYWRSLLSVRPTGNAMVDAGIHEEIRSALWDALHSLQDSSQRLADLEESNADLKQERDRLKNRAERLKERII